MKKYFLPFLVMSAVIVGCSEDEPTESGTATSAPAMTVVTDLSANTQMMYEGVSYTIAFDGNKNRATVDIIDLKYGNGAAVSYRFSNVPYRVEQLKDTPIKRIINVGRIAPDNASSPVFTDLKIDVYESPLRYDDLLEKEKEDVSMYLYCGDVSYTIDGKYKVVRLPEITNYSGKTTTVNSTNQQPFVSDETLYVAVLDFTKMKAVLKVYKPSFDANMPTLGTMVFGSDNEEFGSIDVTLTSSGFKLSCDKLTPFISDTPYPRFEIRNLSMDVVLGGKSTLQFDCMIYKVTAELENGY